MGSAKVRYGLVQYGYGSIRVWFGRLRFGTGTGTSTVVLYTLRVFRDFQSLIIYLKCKFYVNHYKALNNVALLDLSQLQNISTTNSTTVLLKILNLNYLRNEIFLFI